MLKSENRDDLVALDADGLKNAFKQALFSVVVVKNENGAFGKKVRGQSLGKLVHFGANSFGDLINLQGCDFGVKQVKSAFGGFIAQSSLDGSTSGKREVFARV